MTGRQVVGAALVAVGLISLLWGGISWTRTQTVVDLGPIQARSEERKTVPLPPLVGGVALGVGVILLLAPARRRA